MNLKKKLSWTNRKTTVNFYQKKKKIITVKVLLDQVKLSLNLLNKVSDSSIINEKKYIVGRIDFTKSGQPVPQQKLVTLTGETRK